MKILKTGIIYFMLVFGAGFIMGSISGTVYYLSLPVFALMPLFIGQ